MKLSMYVGPKMDVNFAFSKKVKMTATCNFVFLGDKIKKCVNFS